MPTGLYNLGNTCFLNSVLQAIVRCPIKDLFLKDPTRTPATRASKKAPMVSAMQTLLLDLKAAPATYAPRAFLQTMMKVIQESDDDWYRPGQQGDAAECIQYILDSLHDALYRSVKITVHGTPRTKEEVSQTKALESWATFFSKEYSPIVEQFQGQTQICVECQACKSVSERYEPWLMIKAPIPGGDTVGAEVPTFEQCMNAAYETETIEGYACDTCKSPQTAKIRTHISKLPNTLILTFKRFTNQGSKIRGQIDWNLDTLDLRPWCAFSQCPFTEAPQRTYRTFAILEHHGSTRGGHYRMYARDDEWFEIDDESVRKVNTVLSPDSYVLFAIPN